MTNTPILREEAEQLCARIRQENRGKWWTFGGLMCWGCERFSKGDFSKMCAAGRPDYRGCIQLNRRFDAGRG